MKKHRTNFQIVKGLIYKYIITTPSTRNRVIIIFMLVLFSRYIETLSTTFSANIKKAFDRNTKNDQLFYLTLFVLSSIIFRFFYSFIEFMIVPEIQRAYRRASRDTFRHFLSLEYPLFSQIGSGEIHTVVERSSKAVSDVLLVIILEVFPIITSLTLYSIQMGVRMGPISPAILCFSFIIFFYTTIKITKKRNKLRLELNKRINVQSNMLYDSLCNYETVFAYNNKDIEIERYDRKLAQSETLFSKIYQMLYILNFLQRAIIVLQIFVVVILGLYGYYNDTFTGENYMFYMFAVRSLTEATYKAGHIYNKYSTAVQNLKVEYPREITTYENVIVTFDNNIVYNDVKIIYGTKIVLQDINFTIKKGEKVAIVGKNGMGKSSIVNAIIGLTEYIGEIKFDNIDISTANKCSVRDKISYIHQDNLLFNDTVKYNIAYGKKNVTDQEVIDVCMKIGVHESFVRLNCGYETVVGERGAFLSGGERQKVAFARAALKNADILVLDEPTASLDKEAESEILGNVLDNFSGKTMIMIVHNLSLLDRFDKIIFVSEQTVSEVGTHKELMEKQSKYYEFITDSC
ncbi:ATP-binding cassette sub- B member 7 [Conglomerata obtusa]